MFRLHRRDPAQPVRFVSPRLVLVGVAALLGLGGTLGSAATLVTAGRHLQADPAFCSSCHIEAAARWEVSGAAAEHGTCIECHRGPGDAEALLAEVQGLSNILAYYTLQAQPESAHAEVPRAYCTQCHDSQDEILHQHHDRIPPRSGVAYCFLCHGAAAAQDRGDSGMTRSMVPTCSACHAHGPEGDFSGSLVLEERLAREP